MRVAAVLCLIVTTSLVAGAQTVPFTAGHIVFTDTSPPSINVYDPIAGTVTLLSNAPSLISPGGVVATDAGDIAFTDFTARTVNRIDPLGTITVIGATPLFNNVVRLDQDYNGNFVVAAYATNSSGGMPGGSPSQIMTVDAGGVQTPIAILAGNPFGVITAPRGGTTPAGDYITCMPLVGDVVKIDPAGNQTVLASGVFGPQVPALFPNGDVAVTLQFTDEVIRIPRNGGTPTTFVPAGAGQGNIKDIFADGQGGFYMTEAGGAMGSRLMHVDPAGTVTQVLGNSSFGVLQGACLVPHLRAPVSVGTGPMAGIFGLSIEFPAYPNMGYTTVGSASVFPGIEFPGADDRAISVNPDSIFFGTFGTGAPGFTTGWSGTLDGSGRASLLIDLSIFPPGAFSGSRIYLQVGVIDPTALTNVAKLSELAPLVFN